MLYDKRWEYKADPMTLDSLISWLEGRPADKAYDYIVCDQCLLAQYFTACGFHGVLVEDQFFTHRGGYSRLPAYFNNIAVGGGMDTRHTFGEALERARAALQRTEP